MDIGEGAPILAGRSQMVEPRDRAEA
jgi:hypothetical protein